jgi:Mg-chelatase subunit ChlD
MTQARNVHAYFVLDRSGSMERISDDVVGGFNAFVASQRADGDDMVMTLVQFDGQDPHEVIADAVRITEIAELTAATFVPRGMTPLYDAMGRVMADARARRAKREALGLDPEEIIFVTLTDGLENASREFTRADIFEAIKKRQDEGWTFVFLGANQDAFAEGRSMGVAMGGIRNWTADKAGTAAALHDVDRAILRRRGAVRGGTAVDRGEFFEPAETPQPSPGRRPR